MTPWSLELEVLAGCVQTFTLKFPTISWMADMWRFQTLNFFDDSIPMELPYTLYEWLKCTFLHLKVYSRLWKSYTISLVSQSARVVTCSAIFLLETAKFPILDIYPWPWNHHPSMWTIIYVLFWFPPILLQCFI